MKTIFPFPPEWERRSLGDREAVVVPGGEVVVEVYPLLGLPDDKSVWFDNVIRFHLPADCEVKLLPPSDSETPLGWPIHVEQALLRRAGTEALIEARLAMFFRFIDHGTVAMIRAPDAAKLDAERARLLDILGQARPDWTRDDLTSLHDLWIIRPEDNLPR